MFLVIPIPLAYSTITFSSTTYFESSSSSWFNFSTDQTFNTYERRAEWHYFNNKGVCTSTSNATFTNFLTSNWINYTVTGAGQQYFYYFDIPLAVYIDGTLYSEGSGWYIIFGLITVYGATSQVQISWNEIPEGGESPPPPYPEELTSYEPVTGYEAYGTGFDIYVNNQSEIGFETIAPEYNFTFLIYCTTGTWKGTESSLSMDFNGGTLTFHANDTSTLRLYSLTSDELTIGAQGGTFTKTAMNDYSLAVVNGTDLSISWYHPLPSYLDYTMFGVGMFGVGLLVGCPIWAIKKVKDEGILEPDSIQRVGLAAMLMLIGFGLVIAWLWL